MLMFYLLIYKHNKRYKRYMKLSESDRDKIMTFFGIFENSIFWLVSLVLIISRWKV